LLVSEPERGKLSVALQMLKQNVSRELREKPRPAPAKNAGTRTGHPAVMETNEKTKRPPFWLERFTTSMCGVRKSLLRSCATFIATRFIADWLSGQKTGSGAASVTTLREQRAWSKSSHNGRPGNGSGWARRCGLWLRIRVPPKAPPCLCKERRDKDGAPSGAIPRKQKCPKLTRHPSSWLLGCQRGEFVGCCVQRKVPCCHRMLAGNLHAE
jgi:hypothetical protein